MRTRASGKVRTHTPPREEARTKQPAHASRDACNLSCPASESRIDFPGIVFGTIPSGTISPRFFAVVGTVARVTMAGNAMITDIGNSTDASRAKKLRRIARDRMSIRSRNASTNISDSRIRASMVGACVLHAIAVDRTLVATLVEIGSVGRKI